MRRRAFLTSCALVPLAGCSNRLQGSGSPTPSATRTPTESSPTGRSTSESTPSADATFELVSIDAPDSVQLNVPFGFEISVRNTGSRERTFRSKLSTKVGDGAWKTAEGEISVPVPAGEVRTWKSPRGKPPYLQTYHYRLEAFGATWSTEIVPKRLDFGLSYTTPLGLSLNVLGADFQAQYSGSDATATSGDDGVAAPDGKVWGVLPMEVRNRADSTQSLPAPDEFVLHLDDRTYRPTPDVSSNPYEGGSLDGGTTRTGELVYAVPEGTRPRDVEVTWEASLDGGDVKVTWDK